LSNIYEDGTPISFSKQNNNAFLKGKSSNFTSNVYIGGGIGGAYNKNKTITPSKESTTPPPENSIDEQSNISNTPTTET
jgi:hypothetical protein